MEIDKFNVAGSDEAIVLFPRSYNKRGDERLHSVQGVTLDGREVNIKLRIDSSLTNPEATPSIAEFSREDVKAKNPCLAFAENGPDNREGILLFTGCEEDGENRKGIQSYTARWAYVLASHSDSPDPVYGLGRIVMIADSHAAKQIHSELTELEKTRPEGWHALAEHKRKALNDPMLFSYYGHIYHTEMEESFETIEQLSSFAAKTFEGLTGSGIVGGLLIRMTDSDGVIVPGFSVEIFPRWIGNNQYQKADDVMMWFYRSNSKRIKDNEGGSFIAMPIKRYSCGPSFKNYYFLKKPEESLQKIRKRYLINNEPTAGLIAFALSRKEENGDCFLLKYYPLSNPLSAVGMIGVEPPHEQQALDELKQLDPSIRIPVGLAGHAAIAFPAWYNPGPILDIRGDINNESVSADQDAGEDLSNLLAEISDEELQSITEQELIEPGVQVDEGWADQQDLTDEASDTEELEAKNPSEEEEYPVELSEPASTSSDLLEQLHDAEVFGEQVSGKHGEDELKDAEKTQEDDAELNFDDLEGEIDLVHANTASIADSLSIYDSTSEGASTYTDAEQEVENGQHPAEEDDVLAQSHAPEPAAKESPEELTGLARFMKNKGLL